MANGTTTAAPITGPSLLEAYQKVYGVQPYGTDPRQYQQQQIQAIQGETGGYFAPTITDPSGQPISTSTLMAMAANAGGGAAAPAGASPTTGSGLSYGSLGGAPVISMGAPGGGSYLVGGGSSMAAQPASTKSFWSPAQWQQFASASPSDQQKMGAAVGLSSADLGVFQQMASAGQGTQAPTPGALSPTSGVQPETNALAQMAQIDPATEALRNQLSQSYLTPLAQAGAPTAGQFQSLLNTYGQIDPTSMAGRQALGQQLTTALQSGSQLDPATQRQVEQATRLAQSARGNVYGTPQLVEEAMTTGEAGLQLQQQRQQAMQSYLGSGQTTGDVALNLYNQQQNQLRASQGAALGYLGSGSTPYQAGSSYLNQANANAANAAQGGPQYNPSSLGQSYSGTAQQFPQYGLDIGAQSQNMMGAMNYGQSVANQAGAQSGAQTGQLISGIGSAMGSVLGGASKLR